jgi:hypothetical protein
LGGHLQTIPCNAPQTPKRRRPTPSALLLPPLPPKPPGVRAAAAGRGQGGAAHLMLSGPVGLRWKSQRWREYSTSCHASTPAATSSGSCAAGTPCAAAACHSSAPAMGTHRSGTTYLRQKRWVAVDGDGGERGGEKEGIVGWRACGRLPWIRPAAGPVPPPTKQQGPWNTPCNLQGPAGGPAHPALHFKARRPSCARRPRAARCPLTTACT